MATESRSSDAVRITRIVAPTVLIIVLAFLFKSEIGGSMQRGCFQISIENAGMEFSDQSLCSASDVNTLADSLTQLGANKAQEEAFNAFAEFEEELRVMGEQNQNLMKENNEQQSALKEKEKSLFNYARSLEQRIRQTRNNEERMALQRIYNELVEAFNIPTTRSEEPTRAVVIEPIEVNAISSDIRQRYVTKSNAEIRQVQSTIKVIDKK